MGEGQPDLTMVFAGGLTLVALAVAAFVLFATPAAVRRRKRRLAALTTRRRVGTPAAAMLQLAKSQPDARAIDRLAKLLPRRQALKKRLEAAGNPLTEGGYLGVSAALAALVFAGVFLSGYGAVPGAFLGFGAAYLLPRFWLKRRTKKRVARFNETFPEAIDLIVRALRSGLPVAESIINAGREVPGPVQEELGTVESGLKVGRDLDDVLWDIARRLDTPEFRFFVVSLGVQRETGGNLGETLANLSDVLRRRRQMRLKVKALSSEARASAFILGGLPIVVGLLMLVTSPDYINKLLTDPRGHIMMAGGAVMMTIGSFIMAKMIKFEI